MPIQVDQLAELFSERVGTFLKKYGISVRTCNNPADDALAEARRMRAGTSNSGSTVEALVTWANEAVEDHLAYHRQMNTTPCSPTTGPMSAIYQSPEGAGVVWVPLAQLEELTP